jgi:predicted 2-oxoglutarate/Fe(II)-dependent dioxygenase YbiX
MKQAPLTLRRWGRIEYERLADLGAFENDPVELIGGQLIVAEPKGSERPSRPAGSCVCRILWRSTRTQRPSRT